MYCVPKPPLEVLDQAFGDQANPFLAADECFQRGPLGLELLLAVLVFLFGDFLELRLFATNDGELVSSTFRNASSRASAGIFKFRRTMASWSRPASTTSPNESRSAADSRGARSGLEATAQPNSRTMRERILRPLIH